MTTTQTAPGGNSTPTPGATDHGSHQQPSGIVAPEPYYSQDGITIFCGDCRTILPTLEPESIDLVLTDPPYGIALENHGRGDGRRKDRDWTINGDQSTEVGQQVIDYCLAQGWPTVAFASPKKPWVGKWRSYLVWHKPGIGVGGDPELCWMADWELIQVANNGPLTGPKESAVLRWPTGSASFRDHPTQKPIGLCRKLIDKHGGTMILDPFMGSGTTLRAAKDLGRKAIGIEISEAYCEIAARRLQQSVLPLEVS